MKLKFFFLCFLSVSTCLCVSDDCMFCCFCMPSLHVFLLFLSVENILDKVFFFGSCFFSFSFQVPGMTTLLMNSLRRLPILIGS